jgi:hypothetical protein
VQTEDVRRRYAEINKTLQTMVLQYAALGKTHASLANQLEDLAQRCVLIGRWTSEPLPMHVGALLSRTRSPIAYITSMPQTPLHVMPKRGECHFISAARTVSFVQASQYLHVGAHFPALRFPERMACRDP